MCVSSWTWKGLKCKASFAYANYGDAIGRDSTGAILIITPPCLIRTPGKTNDSFALYAATSTVYPILPPIKNKPVRQPTWNMMFKISCKSSNNPTRRWWPTKEDLTKKICCSVGASHISTWNKPSVLNSIP